MINNDGQSIRPRDGRAIYETQRIHDQRGVSGSGPNAASRREKEGTMDKGNDKATKSGNTDQYGRATEGRTRRAAYP